jgi:nicotinamidase-related amidase
MTQPGRLAARDGALLVIDLQERLVPAVDQAPLVLANAARLARAAALLGIPVRATEQYPKGLGPTVPAIREVVPEPLAKMTFHGALPPIVDDFLARGVRHVTLAGIEAHVCVLQTAIELLDAGFVVQVPADAVASRCRFDWEFALRRLERIGVLVGSTESALFEWLGTADHPEFKAISQLVKNFQRPTRNHLSPTA